MVMFACVALMIFGKLEKFTDFFSILQLYFESSLGNWNMKMYEGVDVDGNRLDDIYVFGVIY